MISRALSFLILVYLFGYALFVVLLPRPADDRRTDAIVVLTGGAGRIERGLDLIERGRADRMLISGVARTVRPVELAAQYDADERLFDCCIDLGRESVDTRSNAVETARWLERRKLKTVRLVTTDWHMPRGEFARRPGVVTMLVGPPIPPGLPRRDVEAEVHRAINALEP